MRGSVISRKRPVAQTACRLPGSVPSAGEYRYTARSNEGLRPLGRQARGKRVSPRVRNEGLRPLGRQARGKDVSHCPANGGAAGDAGRKEEKKKQTNRYIVATGKCAAPEEHLIEISALFVRCLCLQDVVTVTTGVGTPVGIAVGTPVTTPLNDWISRQPFRAGARVTALNGADGVPSIMSLR